MANESKTKWLVSSLLSALIIIILAVAGFGFKSIDKVEEKKLDKTVYEEHKGQQVIQEQIDREKFDKIDTKLDKIIEKL